MLRSVEKTTSNLYHDLNNYPGGIRRAATAPSTQTAPSIRIKVEQLPSRTISDAAPRKAPPPPSSPPLIVRTISDAAPRKAPPPLDALPRTSSMKSSSQRNLREKAKKEQLETFFMKVPAPPSDEVTLLKKQIELLETKVEDLQLIVRTLQWHSDPQRQAALEDWAIERMIAQYNQFFPQPKSTIAELVRLFAASKQKSPLTPVEFEHLGSLHRIRDVQVQDFMLTPPWFDQSKNRDIKEIARYVTKQRDKDVRKRNWRLYKFATGRSPKADS